MSVSVASIYLTTPTNVGGNTYSLELPVLSSSLENSGNTTASASMILFPEFNLAKRNALIAQSQQRGNILEPPSLLRISSQISSSLSTLGLVPRGIQKISSSWASSTISRSALTPCQLLRADSGALCAICLDCSIDEKLELYTIAACNHRFHDQCIRKWKKEEATCPLCRGPLPEELGVTGTIKHVQSSDMIQRILDWLPLENERTLTRRDKMSNFFQSPLGFAWVLLITPLLLIIETLCLVLLSPVALIILIAETCNESFNHCFDLFVQLSVIIFLTPIFIVLLAVVIFTLQIPFLIYILVIFCFEVFTCKRKWRDAHSYVARKLIIGTMYTELFENAT